MACYDPQARKQQLYLNDVDKPNPQMRTLEYVSPQLHSIYVAKNALCWLEIEENTRNTTLEVFFNFNIERFEDYDTLVWLGMLETKNFVNH